MIKTISNSVSTDSIDTIASASTLEIGTVNSNEILIGSNTTTPQITIDTLSTLNSNATPAISIGASSSTKTIKIGSNSNSVHCSSLDLQGSAINNITPASGSISIANNQTSGTLNIATNTSRTGDVSINTGLSSTATTTIGNSLNSTIINSPLTATVKVLTPSLDTSTATSMSIAGTNATTLNLGRATQNVAILNTASVAGDLTASTKVITPNIDTSSATALTIGNLNATTINLGRLAQNVNIVNTASVGGDLTASTKVITPSIETATTSTTLNLCNNQITGQLNLGNNVGRSGNLNIATSSTISCGLGIMNGATNSGNIQIKNGSSNSGQVNIATGTGTVGTQTTTVNIASGVTTGLVTIGNVNNNLAVICPMTNTGLITANGGLTMGGTNNITLGTGAVIPTATQLGYVLPEVTATVVAGINTDTSICNTGVLSAGTWIITGNLQFPNITSGQCLGCINTVNSFSGSKNNIAIAGGSGSQTQTNLIWISSSTGSLTFYLVAKVNTTGGNITGKLSAVRIA